MNGAPTPVKTRILAGGVHSAKQQVVRIDRAVARSVDRKGRTTFERAVLAAIRRADAVLLSDYGSGLVTSALARRIRCFVRKGDRVGRMQKVGFIDLGSQVTLFFPVSFDVRVSPGERVVGGVSVIARG